MRTLAAATACGLLAVGGALAAPAAAPGPAPAVQAPLPYGPAVTLDQARRALAAAEAQARRDGLMLAIAVVDPSGQLVAFVRMDGVQSGSVEVSQAKARTAAMFKRPSKAFGDAVAQGRVAILSLPGVVAVEGGVPLVVDGRIIGAIGASGGSSDQDGVAAGAGAASLR